MSNASRALLAGLLGAIVPTAFLVAAPACGGQAAGDPPPSSYDYPRTTRCYDPTPTDGGPAVGGEDGGCHAATDTQLSWLLTGNWTSVVDGPTAGSDGGTQLCCYQTITGSIGGRPLSVGGDPRAAALVTSAAWHVA